MGVGPFIGVGRGREGDCFYKLSYYLISYLSNLGYNNIAHIKNAGSVISNVTYWLSTIDLGLNGRLVVEWFSYIDGLFHLSISLTNEDGILKWSWNKSFGTVTVKEAYDASIGYSNVIVCIWWYKRLWKWSIPLKVK